MDKYKAGYHLDTMDDKPFKVFNSFTEHIPYYLAIRLTPQLDGLMKDGSCFHEQIEKQDVGDLLMNNLKPVMVCKSRITALFSDACYLFQL